MLTAVVLSKAIGITLARAEKWVQHINEAMGEFGIDSFNEQASFLAQIGHESALLSRMDENLNYTSDGLAKTWKARFARPDGKPNVKAISLHKKPQAIANCVYANRMGNGSEASGDGWNYRGRGLIQITGKNNYEACGKALGIPLLKNPDLLLQPKYAALSAGWYWQARGLDKYDDDEDVTSETKLINGGTNGLKDRQALFDRAFQVLRGQT